MSVSLSTVARCLASSAAAAAMVGVPVSAHAAGTPAHRDTQTLDCSGLGTITIIAPPASVGDSWSAAQLVSGGHLIPVSFTYRAEDTTLGMVLDQETVSHGPAHQQQGTVTCSQTRTARLGDLLPAPPGVDLPAGAQPTDTVTLTFIAVAVAEPGA